MSVDESIKAFSAKIVVVDDRFGAAQLESIQDDDWATLRAQTALESWKPIQEAHFPEIEKVIDLKRHNDVLGKAWGLYEANPKDFSIFDPIFIKIRDQRSADLVRLKTLIEYFETDLQIELCKHPSIEAAISDIKQSKLVFLDFYIYQTSADEVIEGIRKYTDLFSGPVEGAEPGLGRIVILISTALPSMEKIELFRKASRLKGAFFKPVPKSDLTKEWLRKEIFGKVSRYDDMQKWVVFLETFSNQIAAVSNALREEIDSLELHDLAILDSVRLQTDSEPLGDYLGWLFSDAVAARLRRSAPLAEAGSEIDKISSTPFHGMLKPKPILFSLFSDIAFAPATSESPNRIRFSDVYSPLKEEVSEHSTIENCDPEPKEQFQQDFVFEDRLQDDLLLVIAPACDLQRCNSTYEVLCVRGSIVDTANDLAGLLGQKPLIGKSSGDAVIFRHFLRHKSQARIAFYRVEWNPKRITTLRASELRDASKFGKRGQINELLGHEIKEESLRQAGRVGVPVDPSFSSPLSAALHINRKKQEPFIKQITETECVAGIFVSANEQNPAKILASEEFLSLLGKLIDEANTAASPITDKVLEALREVQSSVSGIQLGDNAMKEWKGGFKVRLVPEYNKATFFKENAIIFYPMGKITEDQIPPPPKNLTAAVRILDAATESIAQVRDVIVAVEDASVQDPKSSPSASN